MVNINTVGFHSFTTQTSRLVLAISSLNDCNIFSVAHVVSLLVVYKVFSVQPFYFFLRFIYCSEMYKCLHQFFSKTVPDTTSLHETSDLI